NCCAKSVISESGPNAESQRKVATFKAPRVHVRDAVKSDPERNIRHTDSFQAGAFRPHGSLEMWLEGDASDGGIYSTAQGPFNAEFLKAFVLARADLLAKAGQQRLRGHILQMQRSMMASPDMLDEYRRLMNGFISGKMVAEHTAWVVGPEVEGRDF